MKARRWAFAPLLAICISACTAGGPSAAPPGTVSPETGGIATSGPDGDSGAESAPKLTGAWEDFFGPKSVGFSCQREATTSLSLLSDSGPVTQSATVTASDPGPEGVAVTLSVDTAGDAMVLPYLLRTDGQLASSTVVDESSGTTVDGAILFPSPDDLAAGKTAVAEVQASTAGIGTVPGVEMTLRFLVRPVQLSQPIDTPLGHFNEALGVEVVPLSVDSDTEGMSMVASMLLGQSRATTWWVKGVGIVKTDTPLGTTVTTSCEGPGAEGIAAAVSASEGATLPSPSTEPCDEFGQLEVALHRDQDDSSSSSSASDDNWEATKSEATAAAEWTRAQVQELRDVTSGQVATDVGLVLDEFDALVDLMDSSRDEDEFIDALLASEENNAVGLATQRLEAYADSVCGVALSFDGSSTDSTSSLSPGTTIATRPGAQGALDLNATRVQALEGAVVGDPIGGTGDEVVAAITRGDEELGWGVFGWGDPVFEFEYWTRDFGQLCGFLTDERSYSTDLLPDGCPAAAAPAPAPDQDPYYRYMTAGLRSSANPELANAVADSPATGADTRYTTVYRDGDRIGIARLDYYTAPDGSSAYKLNWFDSWTNGCTRLSDESDAESAQALEALCP